MDNVICPKPMRDVYDTSHRAFPLLCSWHTVWICEILTASKPKRTVTPLFICMSTHPQPVRAFRNGIDIANLVYICIIAKFFERKMESFLQKIHIPDNNPHSNFLISCCLNQGSVALVLICQVKTHLISPLTWGMKPHIGGWCSPRCGGKIKVWKYSLKLAKCKEQVYSFHTIKR